MRFLRFISKDRKGGRTANEFVRQIVVAKTFLVTETGSVRPARLWRVIVFVSQVVVTGRIRGRNFSLVRHLFVSLESGENFTGYTCGRVELLPTRSPLPCLSYSSPTTGARSGTGGSQCGPPTCNTWTGRPGIWHRRTDRKTYQTAVPTLLSPPLYIVS